MPETNPNSRPPGQRSPQSTPARWLQQHHARLNAGGGLVLLALAVLIPIIAPAEQRGQVLIMTILFGLVGALMLYRAADVGARAPTPTVTAEQPAAALRSASARERSRALLRARQVRQGQLRAWLGLLFGVLFIVAGSVAPFVLAEGEVNPDARFLMVIGFSPIVVSGALMAWLFARTLRPGSPDRSQNAVLAGTSASRAAHSGATHSESLSSTLATVGVMSGLVLTACAALLPFVATDAMRPTVAGATALTGTVGMLLSLASGLILRRNLRPAAARTTISAPTPPPRSIRRAPVARIPASALYRIVVPAAIVLLVVLIAVVILVVAAATVTPLVQ